MPGKTTTRVRGVYEEKPGLWCIRYADSDGRIRRERAGTRGAAIDLYRQRKSEIRTGIKLPHNMRFRGVTVQQIANDALVFYRSHERKDLRTFTGRMNRIVNHLGSKIADALTPHEIDRWLDEQRKENSWSPATTNRYKTTLSMAYTLAMRSSKVGSNPARLVPLRRENNARIRYLSVDEETNLREAINQRCPGHMAAFDVTLHTGMRKSEQFTLEWDQLDWDRKIIHLTKTKNGSQRDIPMSRTCQTVLKKLLEQRTNTHERVFSSVRYDAPIRDPKKWFEGAVAEADIQNFVWHDLRHTFCSRLVMKGVDLRTVAEIAGHKTISMTMRYSHLAPEHNQAAIEKLDD